MQYAVFEDMMNNHKMKVYRRLRGGVIQYEYYVLNSVLVYDEYHTRLGEYRSYSNKSSNTLETLYIDACKNGTFVYDFILCKEYCSKRCV